MLEGRLSPASHQRDLEFSQEDSGEAMEREITYKAQTVADANREMTCILTVDLSMAKTELYQLKTHIKPSYVFYQTMDIHIFMRRSREHSKRLSNLIRRGRELDLGHGQRGLIYLTQCFSREKFVYTRVAFCFSSGGWQRNNPDTERLVTSHAILGWFSADGG